MIIGPMLKRSGGCAFCVWTTATGVIPGYPYRRIEDAYYDRKLTLEAALRMPSVTVVVRETVDAFQDEVQRMRRVSPSPRRVVCSEGGVAGSAVGG